MSKKVEKQIVQGEEQASEDEEDEKKSYKSPSARKTIVKHENFVVVYGWMSNCMRITGNELLVYAAIHGFTNNEKIGSFKGSLRYLADLLHTSKNTVHSALKKLVKKKYIDATELEVNGVKYVEYHSRMLYDPSKEFVYHVQKRWTEASKYIEQSIQDIGTNNIDVNPEVTTEVNQDVSQDNEGVSPKAEDTPPVTQETQETQETEIADMKKQIAEMQKFMAEAIEMSKQKAKEEIERERKEIEAKYEEQTKVQEQNQNLVGGPLTKPNTNLEERKDDKVKGESATAEAQNSLFDALGVHIEIPTSREEEKSATDELWEEAEAIFFN